MIEGRAGHTATLLPDDTVLVAGGSILAPGDVAPSSGDYLASAELYDPRSEAWTATENMAEARGYGHTATLLPDGRVLVAGGSDLFPQRSLAGAELYDPRSGTWTATGSMIEGRTGHTATLLPDGNVLVSGGFDSDFEPMASAELYDPRTGFWSATASMDGVRVRHTATLLRDGTVLVTGGQNNDGTSPTPTSGDALAAAELYDPDSGLWTATASMTAGRVGHAAALLPDGNVLVSGGFGLDREGTFSILDSAELYDPRSESWVDTGNMIEVHVWHTATPLRDGRVVVAGGSGNFLASAELYDPVGGTWTAIGALIEGREGHTATLLGDGRVLVAGGAWGPILASAELYDPDGGT